MTIPQSALTAFPGGFTPKRLKLDDKALIDSVVKTTHEIDHEPVPSVVFLADGGVWNNIATAWFEDWKGIQFSVEV